MTIRTAAHALPPLLLLSVGLSPLAFTPAAAQVRDAAPVSAGAASIAGSVLTIDPAHRPVRRATVTLASAGSSVSPRDAGNPSRQTLTDDEGHFAFVNLPAGVFGLTVTKPGFLTGYYGSSRPGRSPSAPISLADGQHLDVNVPMAHGASISGQLLDQNGRPQPDLRVAVYEYRTQNGERLLATAGSATGGATTDDRGVYRIWGLQPGTYVISATPQNQNNSNITRMISSDEMQWAMQQTRAAATAPSNATAVANSATAAVAGSAAAALPPAPQPGHTIGYAPVYYPGVTDASLSATVTVAMGEDRGGIDFPVPLVQTARIDGTIVGPDGQPVGQGLQISITQVQSLTVSGAQNVMRPPPPDRFGKFSIPSVAPGTYTLMARSQARVDRSGMAGPGGGMPFPPPPPPPTVPMGGSPREFVAVLPPAPPAAGNLDLWASLDVTVDGQDVAGLTLALRPGMTVAGRTVFEGTQPAPDLSKVRIGLSSVVPSGLPVSSSMGMAKPDGTFQVTGLIPGKYRVTTSLPPRPDPNVAGWALKAAMLNGRDLLDSFLQIRPDENLQDVTVVFSDKQTELTGALVDGAGKPQNGYFVIVATTDRTLWPAATRRLRQLRPGLDGKFKITGLPPGEYYLGAITDTDPPDLGDVNFLDQISHASLKITLADGEKKTQDLRLRGGR